MNFEDRKPGSRVAGMAWGFVLLVFAASRLFYLLAGAPPVKAAPIDLLWGLGSDSLFGTSGNSNANGRPNVFRHAIA
jgi:hypothetical protein